MSRFRNGIAILILCMIGGLSYNSFYKHHSHEGLNLPSLHSDNLQDSVAQNSSGGKHHGSSGLTLGADDNDQLKDSVAEGPAIVTGQGISQGQQPQGNNGQNGGNQPPRGGTYGSTGGGNNQNPNSQLPPPVLSPSGPQ